MRIAYGAGDGGFNLLWVMYDSFLLYFLTEVYHLRAAALAPVLLVSRATDLLSALLFGIYGDRLRSVYGAYRPYLLWLTAPMCLSAILLFTTPALWPASLHPASEARQILFVMGASILFSATYSVANGAYTALLAMITPSSEERVRLASVRFACAAAGVLCVQYSLLRIAIWLGHGDTALGWQRAASVFAGGAAALLLFCFFGTRETIRTTSGLAAPLRETWTALRTHRRLRCILAAIFTSLAGLTCRGVASPYLLRYTAGHPEWIGSVLASNSCAALAACVAVSLLPRGWVRPASLACGCALLGTLLSLPAALWVNLSYARLLSLQVCFGASTGALLPALFALAAPGSEGESSLSLRGTEAFVAALSLAALKLGGALGVLLDSSMLSRAAAAPGALAVHGANTSRLLFVVPPALFFASTSLLVLVSQRGPASEAE